MLAKTNKMLVNSTEVFGRLSSNDNRSDNQRLVAILLVSWPVDSTESLSDCQPFGGILNREFRRHFKSKIFDGCSLPDDIADIVISARSLAADDSIVANRKFYQILIYSNALDTQFAPLDDKD